MKTTKYLMAGMAITAGCILTGCNNDSDLIYTDGISDTILAGGSQDIILDADNLDALALTLYWTDNGTISLSAPDVKAPANVTHNTIELAANPDFTNKTDISVDDGVYECQLTTRTLNGYLSKLGFTPGEKSPLYVRICSRIADNISPKYSETLTVNVTPYHIDTRTGFYLNTNLDPIHELFSHEDNGVYEGFIGAGAWENWWLKEGDGTIWGNDDITGTPFIISSSASAWNFWYPGISGCYYTTLDTQAKEWTALLVENLTVSGDITGEMEYDRKSNMWSLHTSESGEVKIRISGSTKLYNAATGTDDTAAIAGTISFGGAASRLTVAFGPASDEITFTAPGGEYDIIIDLNDPKGWTLSAGTMAPPAEGPSETLWVVGHNDGTTGGWNFDSWLRLYNEDSRHYGGVLAINSLWGYKFYKEENNWEDCWGMASDSTPLEGKLLANDGDNIPAPEAGLYVADVSLTALTYRLTAIESVHYTGLNDDWSLTPMEPTETPGVYTARIVKSADTPWGVKVVVNENWDIAFGGGAGYLRLYQDGFDGDNDLSAGEHTLTVDLCAGTYSYE